MERKGIITNFEDVIKSTEAIDWYEICRFQLSDEFIIKYEKYIEWYPLSQYNIFSRNIIEKYYNEIFWDEYILRKDISLDYLLQFKEYLNWDAMVYRKDITEEIIFDNLSYLTKEAWDTISFHKNNFSIEFFIRNKNNINWKSFALGKNEKRMSEYLYDNIKDVLNESQIKFINNKYNFK